MSNYIGFSASDPMDTLSIFPARLACEICEIEKDRLNEEIAAGMIGWLPNTTAGRERLFRFDDLVCLWLYRQMRDDGLSRSKASALVARIEPMARFGNDFAYIVYVERYYPEGHYEVYGMPKIAHISKIRHDLESGNPLKYTTIFNVGCIRTIIFDRILNGVADAS